MPTGLLAPPSLGMMCGMTADPTAATSGDQATLFTPRPVLATQAGVSAAHGQWARITSYLDLDELSLDLLEARPAATVTSTTDRVVALTFARRFDDALAASGVPVDEPLPSTQGELTSSDVARATCLAARGDDVALAWLRQIASQVTGSFVAQSLLLVGDTRGDAELSTAALRQLHRLGATGRRVIPRVAADLLTHRPRARRPAGGRAGRAGGAAQETAADLTKAGVALLGETIDLLHRATASFVTDPQPVLDTAALLVQGGDREGALLLLSTVDRMNPQVVRIEAMLHELTPRSAVVRQRARRIGLLVVGLVAYAVALATGFPTVAVLWALALLFVELFSRDPGLGRLDTGIRRNYLEGKVMPFFRFARPTSDEALVQAASPAARLFGGGVALLAIALLGLLVLFAALPGLEGADQRGPGPADFGLAFLQWVVIPPVLAMWLWSLRPRRRLGYVAPTTAPRPPQSRCACWDEAFVDGPAAFALRTSGHLVPSTVPPAVLPVLERHAALAPQVLGCPQTGAAWLALTLAPEGGSSLLRSPIGNFPDPEPEDTELSTGQYL